VTTVVSLARAWIGTPYVHQASCRGAGCDCLGLVRGVWRELYGSEPAQVPPYTKDWNEPKGDEHLLHEARRLLIELPREDIAPGRVLLFRMQEGSVAKHLGIVSAFERSPRFIHAYRGHGVCEAALSGPWRRRIAAVFDFPMEV
jgi:NlpC/P60 family putative phage cell wall peptidase